MAQQWADKPYDLLKIPGTEGAPNCSNPEVLNVAIEMSNVHNLLLRGLNSIYLQADKISAPADIADFVLYVKAWQDTVHHHHSTEETLFFPRVEKIAVEAGLPANIMSRNLEQHQEFDGALHALNEYVKDVMAKTKEYESKELVRLVEELAPVLRQHLHDEILTLVGLEKCDGKAVAHALKITADEGAKTADPNFVLPLVFGCIDKTYPGSESFPPVPFFVPYLNAYWFVGKNRGVWRFNPSDDWGKPRPLHFLL